MPSDQIVSALYESCTQKNGNVEYNGLWMHKFDQGHS